MVRFGSGYTLTLRASSVEAKNSSDSGGNTSNENVATLKDLVIKTFPLAELKEEHYNQVRVVHMYVLVWCVVVVVYMMS